MAVRWMMALVEPPIASSTRSAFSTDFAVMICDGRSGFFASSTARAPVASAARSRSACTAGMAAVPGSAMPSASAMDAIVEAVPITAQVPAVVARLPSMVSISAELTFPARCSAQKRRQSVQAPSRSPWNEVGIIGPATSCTAGRSAEAAPMSCAGTVLSQPPSSTTASIGWARIISSTSIDMRFLNIIDVGLRNTSPSDTVGNSSGRPPAPSTPRFSASMSSGKWRWQLLKPLFESAMPTTGRSSISLE